MATEDNKTTAAVHLRWLSNDDGDPVLYVGGFPAGVVYQAKDWRAIGWDGLAGYHRSCHPTEKEAKSALEEAVLAVLTKEHP